MMKNFLKRVLKPFAQWHIEWAQLERSSVQAWSDGVPITMYNITQYSELRFWCWTLDEATFRYYTLVDAPKAGTQAVTKYEVSNE